jgi:hypothetical protein
VHLNTGQFASALLACKKKIILRKLGKLGRAWTIWQQKSHRQLGLVCPPEIKHCNGK